MFSCGFFGRRFEIDGTSFRSGIISFDGVVEVFESPLVEWDETDYENSWYTALQSVTAPQPTAAAIITKFADLIIAPYVQWWPMYPDGQSIAIREQALFLEPIRGQVSISNLFLYVPKREVRSGLSSPSEWSIPLETVIAFRHCLGLISRP